MNIGKAIRTIRTSKGQEQAHLAEEVGISASYMSLIERGRRDPSCLLAQRIADALDVPFSVLVFLSADSSELSGISPELSRNMAEHLMNLLQSPGTTEAGSS